MCGITGTYHFGRKQRPERAVLEKMTSAIGHRGPDEQSIHIRNNYGLGFNRLSIIDLQHGSQPFFNEDKSVVLICNGEIFNYKELTSELKNKGYQFKTACDVEVILHLYLEHGVEFLNKLNGQFAFAIIDEREDRVFIARDQFGICPLFYFLDNDMLAFGSEIKSILEHPTVKMNTHVSLTGLDQIFTFPANVSPQTMFENIKSLKPGHYLTITGTDIKLAEYWDLKYPNKDSDNETHPESYYLERLDDLLTQSIRYRLQADVPVGFYLSGGLDSSLIGGIINKLVPDGPIHSFSIGFPGSENKGIDERAYQRMVSSHINSTHDEINFVWDNFEQKIEDVIYYSESPLKETYNVCSMALSRGVRDRNFKVTLSGEGADELFGGYAGYKFDQVRRYQNGKSLEDYYEEQISNDLWGNPTFIYDRKHYEFLDTKKALYASAVTSQYSEFDCLSSLDISKKRLLGLDEFHIRSYLDMKLRLAGHLIADHGDRMTFANSVEGRYPFLDINLVEFVRQIPVDLKLNGMIEKYILKKLAERYIPKQIIHREKFGFVAPGSPQLLKNKSDWANDILSYSRIKRQGYFNPDTIERLKKTYASDDFILVPPYDLDLLLIVLTFGIFIDKFNL